MLPPSCPAFLQSEQDPADPENQTTVKQSLLINVRMGRMAEPGLGWLVGWLGVTGTGLAWCLLLPICQTVSVLAGGSQPAMRLAFPCYPGHKHGTRA